MIIERVEQRVLGALQLLDRVTRTPVRRPLKISSARATLVRNRRGFYVITRADGLEAYTATFQQPPTAPADDYSFQITDPQKRYLPRLLTLRLPRAPDPDNVGNEDSLFAPRDVAMYPSATASLSHNWSTIRVSVTRDATTPVRGALIRIIDPDEDILLASGISDQRGEALVIVPGVPVTKFADEDDDGRGGGGRGDESGRDDDEPPVMVNTLPVRLELSLGTAAPWPVNPDVLESNHAVNRRVSRDLTLRTGEMKREPINLT